MAVSSRAVVELILLGPTHDRRQLQDSPILGDVWARFATRPAAAVDLLISPHHKHAAGPVAKPVPVPGSKPISRSSARRAIVSR